MLKDRAAWVLLGAVCLAFAWGLVRLYDLRLVAGDIYPVYSSLRSDPLGAEVLFESVAQLPGYSVRRNFNELDELHENTATVLWLGEDPFSFVLRPETDFKQFEEVASRGVRLVIAIMPVKRMSLAQQMEVKESALQKRWGVTFTYVKRLPTERESHEGPVPKRTALVMKSAGQVTPIIEKPFGKGAVVLVDSAYAFSNEALATERDAAFLSRVLGPNRTVIFDEHHLGLSENASIAMLARKYRLTGLGAGLLLLAGLFIWRNSSPLLPPKRPETGDEARSAMGRDSASALRHLLQRNIAEADLIPTCLAEWEKSGRDGRLYSPEKLALIRRVAAQEGGANPARIYARMQSALSHREA